MKQFHLPSTATLSERFYAGMPQTPTERGCLEWARSRDSDGYGMVWHQEKYSKAHRVSWQIYNGREIPDGMVVRHACDNPACINPCHLLLGTIADNMCDKVERGRQQRLKGSQNGNAKLNEAAVAEIKRQLNQGAGQAELARVFGVSRATVSGIKNGRHWQHVGPASGR